MLCCNSWKEDLPFKDTDGYLWVILARQHIMWRAHKAMAYLPTTYFLDTKVNHYINFKLGPSWKSKKQKTFVYVIFQFYKNCDSWNIVWYTQY